MSDPVHGSEAARWGGWEWRDPSRGEHFRRCTHCGCVHPEDLAVEFELGTRAEWADRKYGWPHKFYVSIKNRDPYTLFCIGGSHGGDPDRDPGPGYIHITALTPEQRDVALRDGSLREDDPVDGSHWYLFGTRQHHFGKFYTAHLADPELNVSIKEKIERACGIHFEFNGGRVSWSGVV